MTACPIRYQRQVSDMKGKIFYTSITSLSHISKRPVPASQICPGWGSVKLFGILTFTRNRHSIVSIGTQRVGKQIRFVCHTKKYLSR